MTEEELDLMSEDIAIQREFLAAKKAHQADPTDEAARDAWQDAKAKMREHRALWRGIRRDVQDRALAGDPAAAAAAYAEINPGGAMAAPAPLQTGTTPQGV